MRVSLSKLLIVVAAMLVTTLASAAGIDPRAYTCPNLHALIAAQGFVFISQPVFGDFVVASGYYCGGGQKVQVRSVPTVDNPQCLVNYCVGKERNN
jgi:hypothetical protein